MHIFRKRSIQKLDALTTPSKEKALARGHSIPAMAGAFAKNIGARKLVLNHIGGRFPAPNPNEGYRLNGIRANVIAEIERQATETWGMGKARVAWDFMRVGVPAAEVPQAAAQGQFFTQGSNYGETYSSAGYNEVPTSHNTWPTSEGPSYGSNQHGHQQNRRGSWRKWSPDIGGSSSRPYRSRHVDQGDVDPSWNRNHDGQRKRG